MEFKHTFILDKKKSRNSNSVRTGAGCGLVQSQEPGTESTTPTVNAGTQVFVPSAFAPEGVH